MRPVRRGASPQAHDFGDYADAKPDLVSRLGSYCSFCERRIATNLAVEHIQPKGLSKYAHLEGRWENFLLACVNCNSTKGDKDVDPAEVLLPDRDNTFDAFHYPQDGTVSARSGMSPTVTAMANQTLKLVGLDKKMSQTRDENGHMVALDRASQRMEAWVAASDARFTVTANPSNQAVRRMVVELAKATGFFSIWMVAFEDDPDMRRRLIETFEGTEPSECFDLATTLPVSPAPNPDGLPDGGKV